MTGVSGGPGAISDPGRRPLSRVCRRRGRGAGWPPAPPDARSADPEGTLHPCPAPTLLSRGAEVSHFSHPPRNFLDDRDRAAGQGPALGAASLWGVGRRKNQGDPEAPPWGWDPQPGRRTGACPVLAPLASKTRRVTPPPPTVWFPRGPWGCAASRKAQPWTFQPMIQAGGARVGDTGGETEDETRLMCEAGPRPHRPSPPGCGPSREARKTVGDQGAP